MDPAVQIKITSSICSSVAVGSTMYRLFIRKSGIWADDGWAFFSMIFLIIQVVAVYLDLPDPALLSQRRKVVRYYLMATSFYGIIWSARLSIIFSIIRIDHSEIRRRRLMYVAVLFFLVWIILVAQLFWVCEPKTVWKTLKSPQCPLGGEVAIFQLVYVVADAILLSAPLRLLAILRDEWLRYRLMIIFSTCVITTIVSLVHAVYILTTGGPKVIIAALVEDCISLIVCNIPVVVTGFFNLKERSDSRREGRIPSFIKFATFTQTTTPGVTTISHELSQEISTHPHTVTPDETNSDDASSRKQRRSLESIDGCMSGKPTHH